MSPPPQRSIVRVTRPHPNETRGHTSVCIFMVAYCSCGAYMWQRINTTDEHINASRCQPNINGYDATNWWRFNSAWPRHLDQKLSVSGVKIMCVVLRSTHNVTTVCDRSIVCRNWQRRPTCNYTSLSTRTFTDQLRYSTFSRAPESWSAIYMCVKLKLKLKQCIRQNTAVGAEYWIKLVIELHVNGTEFENHVGGLFMISWFP
jgi:hypothetical protein